MLARCEEPTLPTSSDPVSVACCRKTPGEICTQRAGLLLADVIDAREVQTHILHSEKSVVLRLHPRPISTNNMSNKCDPVQRNAARSSRARAASSRPCAPLPPHTPHPMHHRRDPPPGGCQLVVYLTDATTVLQTALHRSRTVVFSRTLLTSFEPLVSSHWRRTPSPHFTDTSATAASPWYPSPRAYSKANDGE